MKKIIFLVAILFFFIVPLHQSSAETGVLVMPQVIDEQAKARDILEYTVKIKNNGSGQADLYALVSDIVEGEPPNFLESGRLDNATSLAKWVRIKRGAIQIPSGGEAEIPLTVEVNLAARPGRYHAIIVFSQGNNTTIARENYLNTNQPRLALNIEVTEDIIEKAQLTKFEANRNVYLKLPAAFTVYLSNLGNRDITPRGSILIYNRKGEEVAELPVNETGATIAPNGSGQYESVWDVQKGFGKYKARIEIEYGEKDRRDLSDTVFFWILPLPLLLIIAGGLFLSAVVLTVILFKKTYRSHHHFQNNNLPMIPEPHGVLDLRKK
ncbi:hypothetical protein A2303_06485 [Candidatus Falkowbacteria bacterium RIFOXYB2_FULL_47_14]|uniref:Uncharacterized protein n=1 Tax=Candidatus Falkowbacteria bacterium RIFOXYA2_FULL_47_19 TaxID=1797994 RepID=A0A1F5SDY0_9BACT|nr:MAG: hypothetical protein A2227_04550 [Candidatus Falkowbacteria bacterium RIFOXYA2_FULL_47_19]OGF35671.1 MAG: hypothetical protein A2468_04450 [Candidatus Falkowbacteria bacterium RIFOXYC2_FULL_46_15]OGF43186.1 MAG: hypothetical protein A2303_06485 [Candidatus Falkowbacteria bacterium RIFOXYB2_FULL_47_14]